MNDKYQIPMLPLRFDIETKAVMKKIALARTAIGEMKGEASSIPNKEILITTLSLQEAKDSSAIENIITTHDELYQSDFEKKIFSTVAAKEVYNYAHALSTGFKEVKENGFLTINQIIYIQSLLEMNDAGFRKVPGTVLKNENTGELIYTPPQNYEEIMQCMENLERFVNDNSVSDLDPLVKMAIIHHQFESIHPFYDGNGRTGRIINVLYLVKERLLDTPILYMSRYINDNREVYYILLQKVRDENTENAWEEWVMFILEGIEKTSRYTINIIEGIKKLMRQQKNKIREELPKIYSQDLLNNIFKHPYTKIDFVMKDLNVTRITATKYLNKLTDIEILTKKKHGKDYYYINIELYNFLFNYRDAS